MPVGRDANGFEVAETVSRLVPGARPAFTNVSAPPASARPNRGCYETSFTVMNKCGLFSAVPLLNNTTRMEFEEEQINVAFN